jgi:large subunit ribosomal protein L19
MTHQILHKSSFVLAHKKPALPIFKTGSMIEVHYQIVEGDKKRTQIFKGVVISRRGGTSMDACFTVLRNSTAGVKVERTFPVHSPFIEKVIVNQLGRIKQSKAYHFRDLRDPTKIKKTKTVKA